jgi:hypothetical protein
VGRLKTSQNCVATASAGICGIGFAKKMLVQTAILPIRCTAMDYHMSNANTKFTGKTLLQ